MFFDNLSKCREIAPGTCGWFGANSPLLFLVWVTTLLSEKGGQVKLFSTSELGGQLVRYLTRDHWCSTIAWPGIAYDIINYSITYYSNVRIRDELTL